MKVTLTIIISLLFEVCPAQQGWILQPTDTTDSLYSVKFLNLQTGWAAGTNGIIIKTINSGNEWNTISSGTNSDLKSISLSISETDTVLFVCGDSGLIVKSTNLGNNWTHLSSAINEDLNSIIFINSLTGWSCGNNGKIIKTTDAGNNWMILNSNTDIQLNSVIFIDENKGWTCGFGGIFNTTDGGQNWSPQFIDGFLVLRSIYFTDPLHGWSAYYDNQTFGPEITRTTDGGISWINYSLNNSYSISIKFYNSMRGWSTGFYGKINYSTNGGMSWSDQTGNTGEHLNSVFFIDSINGWIAGNSGVILKTTNAGILTGLTSQSEYIGKYSLLQNYPNPFNAETKIDYELPDDGFVKIKLFDVTGKLLKVLEDRFSTAGLYTIKFNSSDIASGIYFYSMESGKFSEVKRLVIVK